MNKRELIQNKARLEREKAKNRFFSVFRTVCNEVGGEGVMELLNPLFLDVLYRFRMLDPKIVNGSYPGLTERDMCEIRKGFNRMIHLFTVQITEKLTVTLFDYLTVVVSLQTYQKFDCKYNHEFNQRMSAIMDPSIKTNGDHMICVVLEMLCLDLFDYSATISWGDFNYEHKKDKNQSFIPVFYLHGEVQNPRTFNTSDGKRQAYRLSWFEHIGGPFGRKIDAGVLGLSDKQSDTPIDVYIQQHAINRMNERLDCLSKSEIYLMLDASFRSSIVLYTGDRRYLIEYRIFDSKIGYMLGEYVDGILLLKTFLFVTNNGTPEGRKLYELYGLGKLDKKYLMLDKLSSYIRSDIGNNEKLKSLFEQIGCAGLLNIEEDVQMLAASRKGNAHLDSNKILAYLQCDRSSNRSEVLDEIAMDD
ncbi:MAG: hypothetical protein H6Q17_357 [Bacteroidetes bacterium]|nr:hypothetical protein [Bacteroidota bacterium]